MSDVVDRAIQSSARCPVCDGPLAVCLMLAQHGMDLCGLYAPEGTPPPRRSGSFTAVLEYRGRSKPIPDEEGDL